LPRKIFNIMIFEYLENPFQLKRLGSLKFNNFVKKHFSYLQSNNTDGSLTPLINSLEPKITTYETWLNKKDADRNASVAKTDSLDEIENNFEDFMDDVWKEVSYKFDKKNPEIFAKCFPNGKSEYNNITRSNAVVLFTRVADFCAIHKAELPAGMDTEAKNFLDSYKLKRGEQQDTIGDVKDGSEDGTELRNDVAKKMKTVFLNLLIKHEDNEAEVLKYYDAEVLNYYKRIYEKAKGIKTNVLICLFFATGLFCNNCKVGKT